MCYVLAQETLISGHGSGTKCTSSAVGQAQWPTLLCRSGQAGPLRGYHYLRGREGAQCQESSDLRRSRALHFGEKVAGQGQGT